MIGTSTIDCLLMNSANGVIKVSKWGEDGNPRMTTSECWPSIGRGSVESLLDLSVGKLFLHHGGTLEPYRYVELATDLTGVIRGVCFVNQ